ncbi:MAG: hypothetical protein ABMA26_26490, partial [Limisphaerales bacterium]
EGPFLFPVAHDSLRGGVTCPEINELFNKEARGGPRGGDDLSSHKIPDSLNTVPFLGKWGDWMKHRRGLRKVKEWRALFQEQLDWLARFDESTATEILATSIRNGWQGLFPLNGKAKEKRNGNHTRHPSTW